MKRIEPDFEKMNGLIPVIVQEVGTNEVLMLAYMNREALERTLKTGLATYWSRSRNELWCKGETSGHYQHVVDVRIDCDQDTILLSVKQDGAACHTGNHSCFYRPLIEEE
ncbi:phosphoribosyl-AMP cyclohydrolase [Ileibacterium valens]|nr:phosphoribosyl-AMP cyclohydrolase [Ileibacterium valens]